MTPKAMLEEAKSRFIVLYHNDETVLNRLLRQALGKFQDKAGLLLEIWSEESVFYLPPHFHTVASCCDNQKRYIPWRIKYLFENQESTNNEITENDNTTVTVKIPTIELCLCSKHEAPYCLLYFADLRNWPEEEDVPCDCNALIVDYLEALIAVYNTQRQKEAYFMAGMEQPAQELLSASDLKQRVSELEQVMEDNKAFIAPASSF